MRKTINVVLMAGSLILILGLVLAIGAETEEPRKEKRGNGIDIDLPQEDIPRLMEIIKIWKLVDELGLDEGQLVEFLPRLKALDDLTSRFYRGRREAVRELRKLLEADAPEAKLKSVMSEYVESEKIFYTKYREARDALKSDLTVRQQAQYMVFEEEYRGDMRRLVGTLKELSKQREPKLDHQPVPLKKAK